MRRLFPFSLISRKPDANLMKGLASGRRFPVGWHEEGESSSMHFSKAAAVRSPQEALFSTLCLELIRHLGLDGVAALAFYLPALDLSTSLTLYSFEAS